MITCLQHNAPGVAWSHVLLIVFPGAGMEAAEFAERDMASAHHLWIHRESCRLLRKVTSGLVGKLTGSKPREKGHLGWPIDPTGRNASEVRADPERVDADANPPFSRGRPRGQGHNRHAHLSGLPGYWAQHGISTRSRMRISTDRWGAASSTGTCCG